jgi:hypothetical protein
MSDAILVLACLLTPLQPPMSRADLEMTAAVEGFAHATPPAPYRDMIARLGSERWADREAASRALESAVRADRSAVRWLFVGRRDRDPEVAMRCNAAIRRLHRCRPCGGTGRSRAWPNWECYECGGTSTAWPWTTWD